MCRRGRSPSNLTQLELLSSEKWANISVPWQRKLMAGVCVIALTRDSWHHRPSLTRVGQTGTAGLRYWVVLRGFRSLWVRCVWVCGKTEKKRKKDREREREHTKKSQPWKAACDELQWLVPLLQQRIMLIIFWYIFYTQRRLSSPVSKLCQKGRWKQEKKRGRVWWGV